MIRAAAKNHEHVTVAVDAADYPAVVEALSGKQSAEETAKLRRRLAWKAFQHTATYDSTVAEWLWTQTGALVAFRRPCPGQWSALPHSFARPASKTLLAESMIRVSAGAVVPSSMYTSFASKWRVFLCLAAFTARQ